MPPAVAAGQRESPAADGAGGVTGQARVPLGSPCGVYPPWAVSDRDAPSLTLNRGDSARKPPSMGHLAGRSPPAARRPCPRSLRMSEGA